MTVHKISERACSRLFRGCFIPNRRLTQMFAALSVVFHSMSLSLVSDLKEPAAPFFEFSTSG